MAKGYPIRRSRSPRFRDMANEAVQISRPAQYFLSAHDGINNPFHLRRGHVTAGEYRAARGRAFTMWADISGVAAAA
jgi:putative transposase